MQDCVECGIEFSAVRKTAKYCSPKCRVTVSRRSSIVTDNVTLSDPDVTLRFKFTVIRKKGDDKPNPVREAKYWYDVPLSAVPVLQSGWPKMPDYMDGRKYFLWWKNEFKTSEAGNPVIHNPFPLSDKPVVYVQAGENSRHWGTN